MVQGASKADSAYGHDALPLHTDMTYFQTPPGLQIFTMIQPASMGGESIFCDGLAVAETLRRENYPAFDILCKNGRTYRCMDEDVGWHLEATGPIIQAVDHGESLASTSGKRSLQDQRWGSVLSIRHNDLDRLPDLPPYFVANPTVQQHDSTVSSFYQDLEYAHKALDEILTRDEFRLVVKLKPGETVVVVNQRCLHGRYAFKVDPTNPRKVMGCYVSQDDLLSMFRCKLGVQCT